MNIELAKFSRRGTFKWICIFERFVIEHDYLAGQDVEKAIFTNIQTVSGNIVAAKHKVNLAHISQTIKDSLFEGAVIMFTASVEQKRGYKKYYEMIGINNIVVFSPRLINFNSTKETVWNLKKEEYTVNDISFLLGIYSDMIHRIIRENEELLAELDKKTQWICSAVRNLIAEGYSRKEVGEILGMATSTVTTYIPVEKDEKVNFKLMVA